MYSHQAHRAFPPADAGTAPTGLGRGAEIVASALLGLLLLPLLVGIALAIKLESRGPVLYRCRRVGHRGRQFDMVKFRKMRHGAVGAPLTVAADDRFTRVGRFLAATKLDELPQLWNVIRGEMSLVGPRPEDPRFVDVHRREYDAILAVRPGITGPSQLAFARESALLPQAPVSYYEERLLPQKLHIDAQYVSRKSAQVDATILLWTLLVLLVRPSVAVDRQSGRLTIRKRPNRLEADPGGPRP